MEFYKLFAGLAVTAALTLNAGAVPARQQSSQKTLKKSRKELVLENARLKAIVDSLLQEVDALKDTAYMEEVEPELNRKSFSLLDGVAPETYSQEVTDSLLNLWYLHRQARNAFDGSFDMDSVHFTSNVPDKVFLERLAGMNSFITLPYNETVRNYIILYAEKMPSKMAHMLALASYYFPIFESVLNQYDMPEELKYMAVIESALNPVAVSRAGAKGMWQFMYTTAKNYGLTINSYVDERLDPFKAADAAAKYLHDSYRIFGDWNLAISSYNCGAGNVNKAIRRSGGSSDFWKVYDYLPKETRGYVPAFVGAMYAFTYYKEHGIVPDKVQMPAHLDTFQIHRMLHFQQIHDMTGISVEELRNLNPQYVHDIIPGSEKEYILRLPLQYSGKFIECEDSVYTHRAKELFNPTTLRNISASGTASSGRITYRVKSGDYLGKIASRYHVTVAQLKKWNHLRSNNLRIGQVLVIYKSGSAPVQESGQASASRTAVSSSSAPSSASSPSASAGSSSRDKNLFPADSGKTGSFDTYVVKKGDTLYSIARLYPGVSANDIMSANGIGTAIQPGMKLKIPKK